MKLENEFTVPVSLEDAWKVLLDVERVAPCMPGATLLTHDGDDFTGTVKVKVGPIQVTYKGNARFVERDDSTHRAVIEASGREARGSGTAAATVTTSLHEAGSSTRVLVETDLNVTGRPAQFGRGVMSEVATKLIGQFADCLSHEVTAGSSTTAEPGAPDAGGGAAGTAAAEPVQPSTGPSMPPTAGGMTEPAPAPPTPLPGAAEPRTAAPTRVAPVERKPHHASEVIDLVESAGGSIAKRAWPVAVAVLLLILVLRRRRR